MKVKFGHTGTLDPNATGVLPILLGSATKLSKYLINHDKIYEVTLELGTKTDTADSEGNVIEEKEVDFKILNKEYVEHILNQFMGVQEQVPPMYSAIKVNGKKLYEYAREGKKVDVKSRKIEIYEIKLIDVIDNKILFKVHCSKGTYIRSLCEDIAEKIGTVGYMKELRRTRVGDFKIENAIKIENISKNNIISVEEFLMDKEIIVLNRKTMLLFLNGVKIKINNSDGIYRIYNENKKFIGSGIIDNNLLKRDIII